MKFSFKFYKNSAYILLGILLLIFLLVTFTSKSHIVKNLNFREKTNINSNTIKESFTNNSKYDSKLKKEDNIMTLIDRKLKGLTEEMGGIDGKKEVKQILKNSQKIVNMECAKCMMNMIDENKGMKSIDFDKLFQDESNDDCIKCKKYTELSTSLQNMINNL
tara:strand:+ start:917 stop:1402 length:486 start_codon:yes stop_codon:yes gene_type:complete